MAQSETAERFRRLQDETTDNPVAVAMLVLAEVMNKLFDPDKFGSVLFDGIARAMCEPIDSLTGNVGDVASALERLADASGIPD